MSISNLKLAANRQNALRSTGPRTPEGKKRSSINALRHALTGQVVVLPHEDMEAYKSFCQGFFDDLAPHNTIERQLVQTLIDTQWLLNRCHSHEHSVFALGHFGEAAEIETDNVETHAALTSARQLSEKMQEIEVLSRHGTRLSRRFQATIKQLHHLQDRRKLQEDLEMREAVKIGKLHTMKDQPYVPAEFGFVLNNAQIDLYTRRQEAIIEANLAGKFDFNARKMLENTIEERN